MSSQVKKNYLYNLFYQILLVALPVITTPYVSHILGSEKIGIWSFTFSIVTYFTLIGSLGVSLYGRREIARHQDDPKKRTRTFWQINLIKWLTLSLSLVIFYFTCIRNVTYGGIYLILTLEIFSSVFDISWFFQGIENFKTITIRNTIIKFISVISIFTFVKTANDLWLYALINVTCNLISNLSLWVILPKYLHKKSGIKGASTHLLPILAMFIPQVAIQIYTILDKSMLGLLNHDLRQNGIYEQSQNIIKIALTLVTSLGVVMMPRIASLAVKNDRAHIKTEIEKAFHLVWLLALPICFGLAGVASNLVPWFLGQDFLGAISIIQIAVLLILAIGLSNVTGTQFLVPTGQDRAFTFSVIAGAIVNLIGNFILIPPLKAMGAIIASVIAEVVVFLVQFYFVRTEISARLLFKDFKKPLFSSLLMFAIVHPLANIFSANFFSTTLIILIGATTYSITLLLLGDTWAKKYSALLLQLFRFKK